MLIFYSCFIDKIYLHEIKSLRDHFTSAGINNDSCQSLAYNKIIGKEDFIINEIVRKPYKNSATDAFVRAGPRSPTHFDPLKVRAAIVTCGGLCPGLNNVIRELVHALHYLYEVEIILGVRFKNFYLLLFFFFLFFICFFIFIIMLKCTKII
jgi:hypothetical protein